MEPTAGAPGITEMHKRIDRTVNRFGIGAIASPMAVSFREEKLGLYAAPDNFASSAEPSTRSAETDGVA